MDRFEVHVKNIPAHVRALMHMALRSTGAKEALYINARYKAFIAAKFDSKKGGKCFKGD